MLLHVGAKDHVDALFARLHNVLPRPPALLQSALTVICTWLSACHSYLCHGLNEQLHVQGTRPSTFAIVHHCLASNALHQCVFRQELQAFSVAENPMHDKSAQQVKAANACSKLLIGSGFDWSNNFLQRGEKQQMPWHEAQRFVVSSNHTIAWAQTCRW